MKKIIIFVVVAIVIGGGAFYGGMVYGRPRVPVGSADNVGRGRLNARAMSGIGTAGTGTAGFVLGDILSKDDKSITVKMRDGSSKIVFFSASTQVRKSVDGSLTDLANGNQVTITGSSNPDGSITAQTIQIGR